MLDSGSMDPFHPRSSDINVHDGGCVVATREKTAVLLSTDENNCLHYVLYLMQLSIAQRAITSLLRLNTMGFARYLSGGGLLVIDACWLAVYLS